MMKDELASRHEPLDIENVNDVVRMAYVAAMVDKREVTLHIVARPDGTFAITVIDHV